MMSETQHHSNLNFISGMSRREARKLLSKHRKSKNLIWDSIRLVHLRPEDVWVLRPVIIEYLQDYRGRDEDRTIGEFTSTTSTTITLQVQASMTASSSSPELESLILDMLKVRIFNAVYWKCPNRTNPGIPVQEEACHYVIPVSILRAILNSPFIQKLTICNAIYTKENSKVLGLTVNLDGRQCCSLETLEFVTCDFLANQNDGPESSFRNLSALLRRLPRLKTLKVWYNNLSLQDQYWLWTNIRDHPSLLRMDWMEKEEQDETPQPITHPVLTGRVSQKYDADSDKMVDAFRSTLESPHCNIRVLGLSIGNLDRIALLFRNFSRNTTVQGLDLSYCGNVLTVPKPQTEKELFGALHKFQKLRNLDLFCTRLSESAFRALVQNPVARLEHISCWGDHLWSGSSTAHAEWVLKILDSHPRFQDFYGGLQWRTNEVQFLLDLRKVWSLARRKGTHHLALEYNIPPGLWPIILQRANQEFLSSSKRQSRVLYWLIYQGPGFLALPLGTTGHPVTL